MYTGIAAANVHLVVISYDDNGIVTSFEKIAGTPDLRLRTKPQQFCVSSGECFRLYFHSGAYTKKSPLIVVFATHEEDKVAKLFSPNPELCTVYF